MLAFLADENLDIDIVRGLLLRKPVNQNASIRQIIEDVLLLAECSFEGEWEGQIKYIPLT